MSELLPCFQLGMLHTVVQGLQEMFKLYGSIIYAEHCRSAYRQRLALFSSIAATSEHVMPTAGVRDKELQENWQRVSTAFPALENAYFAQREAVLERHARQTEPAQQSQQLDVRCSPDDHLQAFSKDLSHFCRHSKLTVWCLLNFQTATLNTGPVDIARNERPDSFTPA